MENNHKCLDNLREGRTAFQSAPTSNTFQGTNSIGRHNSLSGSEPRFTAHWSPHINQTRKKTAQRMVMLGPPHWTEEVISPSGTGFCCIYSSSAPWWITRAPNGGAPPPSTSGSCRCNNLRLRPACQRPACTRFRARAGDWRFCVLRDSDRLVAKWRQWVRAVCFWWRIVP